MPPTRSMDDQKRAAALAAAAEIADGMVVGLGTGSTVAFLIEALAERVSAGLKITVVPTSLQTAHRAEAAGLQVITLPTSGRIDLAIDGIDEIDPGFRAIKGAGGALLREKVVAAAAARMIAIGDASKPVARLGKAAVPVEILPFALPFVVRRIGELGGQALLRSNDGGASIATDQGNIILDCQFDRIADPQALATELSSIPGILGHGLFLDEIDFLYVGTDAGVLKSARLDRHL